MNTIIMIIKRYLVLILISGLLVSCSDATDWEKFGLKEAVKTYTQLHYEPVLKDGKWEKGELAFFGHTRAAFDENGNYLRMKYFDNKDKYAGEVVPTRKDGKVIEETFYYSDGSLLNRTEIEHLSDTKHGYAVFNAKGEKTSEGKFLSKNNRMIKQKFKNFDEEGKEYLTTFNYNENGNMSSRKQIDNNGTVTSFTKYEYLEFDKFNNWTKRLEYDSENSKKPDRLVIREYDYY